MDWSGENYTNAFGFLNKANDKNDCLRVMHILSAYTWVLFPSQLWKSKCQKH